MRCFQHDKLCVIGFAADFLDFLDFLDFSDDFSIQYVVGCSRLKWKSFLRLFLPQKDWNEKRELPLMECPSDGLKK